MNSSDQDWAAEHCFEFDGATVCVDYCHDSQRWIASADTPAGTQTASGHTLGSALVTLARRVVAVT